MNTLYEKHWDTRRDAYVKVRSYDGDEIEFKLSDGRSIVGLDCLFFIDEEAQYEQFITVMEAIKFAANAAMDEAADIYARVLDERDRQRLAFDALSESAQDDWVVPPLASDANEVPQ